MSFLSHAIHFLLLLQPALSVQVKELHFFKATNASLGAFRLAEPWTASSRLSCAAICKTRYPSDCFSFMYNHVTRQCSPAGLPDIQEEGPSSDEGQLYTSARCDTSNGFALYSYGTTVGCLHFPNTVGKTHDSARSVCQSLSSWLVTIKNPEKKQLLINLITKTIHIGLTDRVTEDRFIWEDDGSEIAPDWKTDFFSPGEPNNVNDEDCITFFINEPQEGANDIKCDTFVSDFICERSTT